MTTPIVAGAPARRPATSAGVALLAAIALVAALYAAREVLVPVALALVLVALLHPIVRWLQRMRVPAVAGAAITVIGSLALLVGVGAALVPPLRGLAADVPKSVEAARTRLSHIGGPFGAPLAQLLGAEGSAPAPSRAPSSTTKDSGTTRAVPPAVADTSRARRNENDSVPNATRDTAARGQSSSASSGFAGIAGRAFGTTSSLLASTVEVLLLALFVLAAGGAWRERLGKAVAAPESRAHVVEAVDRIRGAVARYLFATALINVAQGALVAGVAWLIHLPSPPLWGALTFLAELVPYLGGATLMVLLLIVGLATGGGARALAMPGAYLVITSLQNNLVSPIVYGRGLRLNPAAILVSVMVWWALWGVAGAFLAVPMLAAIRILADYVDLLRPIGPFLDG